MPGAVESPQLSRVASRAGSATSPTGRDEGNRRGNGQGYPDRRPRVAPELPLQMPAGTAPTERNLILQILQADLEVFRALADPRRGFRRDFRTTAGGLLDQPVERTHDLAHLPA